MKLIKNDIFICLLIISIAAVFWFFYSRLEPTYLTNPDSAKFASVGRSIKNGKGLVIGYALNTDKIGHQGKVLFTSPPLYPFILSIVFRIFGHSDTAIINTSGFFYIGCAIIIYLLGKKLFNNQIGFMSSLVFIFNAEFLLNTLGGNADSFFTFIFLFLVYLLTYNNILTIFFSGILACLLIAVKIQGVIYFPFIFVYLLKISGKKQLLKSVFLFTIVFIVFYIFLYSLKIPIPPPRNLSSQNIFYLLFYNSSLYPGGTIDQVGKVIPLSFKDIIKVLIIKEVTNIYYIIKVIPTITSPFIITLFILSFLKKENDHNRELKKLTILLFIFLLCFTAITVLNLRYVYPIIPLIIIFSIEFFVNFINKFSTNQRDLKIKMTVFFIIIFIVFQMTQLNLGAKLMKTGKNINRQNLYYQLGKTYRLFSTCDQLIATNLEIWGTWYGKRKTVLIPSKISELQEVDYILLSSFSPGTEMSKEWQTLFDKPKNFSNYSFVKKFNITSSSNYQNIPVTLVLFKRIK